MSGYVEGGYLVTICVVSGYALTLLRRERVVRRRLQAGRPEPATGASDRVLPPPGGQR